LHKNTLKYILIEGQKSKILISPLKNSDNLTINKIIEAQNLQGNDDQFFIAITTHPMVNLGGIFLKTRQSLLEIKKALIVSGESFTPPLRHFSEEELKKMFDSFNTRDNLDHAEKMDTISLNMSDSISQQLNKILKEFSSQTTDLIESYIILDGGFTVAHESNENNKIPFMIESDASMAYSLFSTSDKCAWFLKKMHIDSILLECDNYFQFIHKTENGIFATTIAKGQQKLGLLRMIMPRYCNKIAEILKKMKNESIQPKSYQIDFKTMFSELIL
jgi:predicted regulator of Ras-like GTPase activity (Roadblock/LC7/MglB family)